MMESLGSIPTMLFGLPEPKDWFEPQMARLSVCPTWQVSYQARVMNLALNATLWHSRTGLRHILENLKI